MRTPQQYLVSCRAVWSNNTHNEAQLICKTRYLLESSFIVYYWNKTNIKTSSNIARPKIAYFIVFRKNSKENKTLLFSCLRDTGMNASVTRISSNKKLLDEKYAMIQGLKQVFKITKFIFSYFKRSQRHIRNPVRQTMWSFFVKK